MKITLDIPDTTRLMFVNYAFIEDSGSILMGCKQIDTEMLKDGAEYNLKRNERDGL